MSRSALVRSLLFLSLALGSMAADISLGEVAAEKWLKVQVGELTVITDGSEGKLREWAAEMSWFQNGLRTALPVGGTSEPATLFLFKSDRNMRRYLPDHGKNPMLLSGFFASVAGQNVAMIGLGGSRFDVRAKLFHEMTHWHLAGSGVEVPLWLHEGLAQVFEEFTLQGDAFRIGHDLPGMFEAVRIAGTPPVGPLLTRTNLDYTRAGWKHGQTNLFYAQSWALVHMLMFGADGGNPQKIIYYLNALRSGDVDAEAFQFGFGLTPEEAREKLDVYIRVPRWRFTTLPLDRSVKQESFRVETLTAGEVYRQFGMLLLATSRVDTAAQFIHYACATDGTDPRNWELAGMLALSRQPVDMSGATEALERARRLSSRNPWVDTMLGWNGLQGVGRGDATDAGQFNEDRLREAGQLFVTALKLRPSFKAAIEGLAGVVLSSANPSKEFRAVLLESAAAGARSPLVQMALADGEMHAGQSAAAALRLEKLLGGGGEIPAEIAARAREMLAAARAATPK